eukprot:gene18300-24760_t
MSIRGSLSHAYARNFRDDRLALLKPPTSSHCLSAHSLPISPNPCARAAHARDSSLVNSETNANRFKSSSSVCRATPDDETSAEDSPPEIDLMASMLSREAANLRASFDEVEFMRSVEDPDAFLAAAKETPFGQLTTEFENSVLEEIGLPMFDSDEFEVLQRLGRISVGQQMIDPTNSGGADVKSIPRTAVIAYVARYEVRLPFMEPAITLLKEYLPMARPVACNELLLLKRLCGIPQDKQAIQRIAEGKRNTRESPPPVVPLLGYFTSIPSQDATMMLSDEDVDSIWLVYKWEGLRPLDLYMEVGPPKPIGGFFKSNEKAAAEGWMARQNMLRAIALGLLQAVDYCHSADVVHGSISSGSVMLSSTQDEDAKVLRVKLDGFGFGKWFIQQQMVAKQVQQGAAKGSMSPSLSPEYDETMLEEGKRLDLQGCGLVLLRLFLACCMEPKKSDKQGDSAAAPEDSLEPAALQQMLFNTYYEDILQFRDYCLQNPARYGSLVQFLDGPDGGVMNEGWGFLSDMLYGKRSALELAQHRFLIHARSAGVFTSFVRPLVPYSQLRSQCHPYTIGQSNVLQGRIDQDFFQAPPGKSILLQIGFTNPTPGLNPWGVRGLVRGAGAQSLLSTAQHSRSGLRRSLEKRFPIGACDKHTQLAMGVGHLWSVLQGMGAVSELLGQTHHEQVVDEVDGKVIAVDLSTWVMEAFHQTNLRDAFQDPLAQALKMTFERSLNWLRYGCTPVFVDEGDYPDR